ncbi:DMT family transporter [Flavisphingomonas formosensis]|uniref:DMT family transporter n=1 Tax=Flavisphingomonas formosensis TaxID=861534 RepID=UPI0012F8CC44|nr:DMT family transporter [Sphingomonas formosensis]
MALLLRFCSIALVSTTFMLGKLAAQSGIHLVEMLFWRQAIGAPILIAGLAMTNRLALLHTHKFGGHIWRAILGLAAMALSFETPILLPLPVATTLGFTAPLFALLLGVAFFGQRASRECAAAVLLGFLGVLILVEPGRSALPLPGTVCGLAGAFMVALISYQLRDLARTEHPLSVVFWFSATSSPVLALALPFVMHGHTPIQWLLLASIGMLGVLAQFFMSAALRYGAVTSIIVMDYTALIWSVLFGWLIWHEPLSTSTWLGAPLIIAAGSIVVLAAHRAQWAADRPNRSAEGDSAPV